MTAVGAFLPPDVAILTSACQTNVDLSKWRAAFPSAVILERIRTKDCRDCSQHMRHGEPEEDTRLRFAILTGIRELIERPNIIVYEIHEDRDEILILAVVHGAIIE